MESGSEKQERHIAGSDQHKVPQSSFPVQCISNTNLVSEVRVRERVHRVRSGVRHGWKERGCATWDGLFSRGSWHAAGLKTTDYLLCEVN